MTTESSMVFNLYDLLMPPFTFVGYDGANHIKKEDKAKLIVNREHLELALATIHAHKDAFSDITIHCCIEYPDSMPNDIEDVLAYERLRVFSLESAQLEVINIYTDAIITLDLNEADILTLLTSNTTKE